jgi:hypothetical protein
MPRQDGTLGEFCTVSILQSAIETWSPSRHSPVSCRGSAKSWSCAYCRQSSAKLSNAIRLAQPAVNIATGSDVDSTSVRSALVVRGAISDCSSANSDGFTLMLPTWWLSKIIRPCVNAASRYAGSFRRQSIRASSSETASLGHTDSVRSSLSRPISRHVF